MVYKLKYLGEKYADYATYFEMNQNTDSQLHRRMSRWRDI